MATVHMKRGVNRRKLLVIDDDQNTRVLIREMLDGTGIGIIEAFSGTEAFEIYQSHRHETGMVLLDILLPGCDGWTLAGMIRRIDPLVPLIAISAMPPADLDARYRAAGFTGYASKPLQLNSLKQTIISCLL
jgi:CheY-like chemotaxis protein